MAKFKVKKIAVVANNEVNNEVATIVANEIVNNVIPEVSEVINSEVPEVSEVVDSVKTTKNILIVDESTLFSSYSSNISTLLLKEKIIFNLEILCSEYLSIPSSKDLELQALPSKNQIVNKAKKICQI